MLHCGIRPPPRVTQQGRPLSGASQTRLRHVPAGWLVAQARHSDTANLGNANGPHHQQISLLAIRCCAFQILALSMAAFTRGCPFVALLRCRCRFAVHAALHPNSKLGQVQISALACTSAKLAEQTNLLLLQRCGLNDEVPYVVPAVVSPLQTGGRIHGDPHTMSNSMTHESLAETRKAAYLGLLQVPPFPGICGTWRPALVFPFKGPASHMCAYVPSLPGTAGSSFVCTPSSALCLSPLAQARDAKHMLLGVSSMRSA